MNLAMVTESASQIAWAIKRIMEVDVVIIDDELNRITDTFSYPRQRIEIRKNSIVGRIIDTGKPLAIDDKERFQSCIDCIDFECCEMKSLIGVPIIYEDKVIGAIALAIPPKFMKGLFMNLSHTIGFLEKMAEMLSGKLQAEADYQSLNLTKTQREILIDSMDEAIVLIDETGLITFSNKRFKDWFFAGQTVFNLPVSAVIRHTAIERFLQNKQSFQNKLIYYEYKNVSFDGFCTAKPVEINGVYHGAVVSLKSINTEGLVYTHEDNYRIDKFRGVSSAGRVAVAGAKAAAQNDEPILIGGPAEFRNFEMAQAIHAESHRKDRNFLVVDCANDSDIALETELFGPASGDGVAGGKLRMANKGTLCIRNISKLPQFLQRRLSEFMCSRTIVAYQKEISSDVRIMATAAADLRRQTAIGMFDEALYERIAMQTIYLPQLGDNAEDVEKYLDYNFGYYSRRYGMNEIQIEPGVIERLCSYEWPGDLRELKNVVEYLVSHSKNHRITMDMLEPIELKSQSFSITMTADRFLEEQIIKMMATGKTRDEMAEILGISRATLFRKIKKITNKENEQ